MLLRSAALARAEDAPLLRVFPSPCTSCAFGNGVASRLPRTRSANLSSGASQLATGNNDYVNAPPPSPT